MFPYGAQYYRTPNPPESEWEKDFRSMVEHGFTITKIWAMWSWIQVDEDQFDFDHFDKLFALAERHGIKLLVNTILENTPYWLITRHPEARYEASDGLRIEPIARPNTPGGAWPGLCLDNTPVREQATHFLTVLGNRYADHPALWGYDVWNEVFFEPVSHPGLSERDYCYCTATKARFVEWLKQRYGELAALCAAWRRRYTDWGQVYPPRYWGGYPDWLDWLKFRLWTTKEQMRWRVATLRQADPNHPLTSHGLAATLWGMPHFLTDDWDIAAEVDQWGLSTFPAWVGQQSDYHFRIADLAHSAARAQDRRIWQTELQGGQSANGLERSFVPRAADTATWNWTALMCGCKGLLYWQWRPELLGPESPGFGLCQLDGSPSERSRTAAQFAEFLNSHLELAEAEPIKGDLAILVLPESELFCYCAEHKTDHYADSAAGAYRAFWERNIIADFAKLEQINDYRLIYLPFPLMIEQESARQLIEYVRSGGVLVAEACPAHFGDNGYCSFRIPGLGLDEVFGAIEEEVEYIRPGQELPGITCADGEVPCAVYRERLRATSGTTAERFADGTPAVVDHAFGEGKARLIGTYLGASYLHQPHLSTAQLICDSLLFAGLSPRITVSDNEVKVRVHQSGKPCYLYALNLSSLPKSDVGILLSGGSSSSRQPKILFATGEGALESAPGGFRLGLSARTGLVARLR